MKRERRIGAGAVLAQATHRPHRPRGPGWNEAREADRSRGGPCSGHPPTAPTSRSEEHTSELQSRSDLVCRLLLEKKKTICILPTLRLLLALVMKVYLLQRT